MRITTPNRTIYTKEAAKALVALMSKPAEHPKRSTFVLVLPSGAELKCTRVKGGR